jgi:hypothetical protein
VVPGSVVVTAPQRPEPLDLAPIEARIASANEIPACREAYKEQAPNDARALLAEVRRLRAAELGHLGMVGRAFTESARQVREVIAGGVMPAHLMTSTSMAVHPNRLVQLADRLDRQGEAAQVLADEAVPR